MPSRALRKEPESAAVQETAFDEQRWVEACISGGVRTPQWAVIRYRTPALIYGRSASIPVDVSQRATLLGCEVIRRRSGGGTVFAGPWMLGLNLLLPSTHAWFLGGHVAAFRAFGSLWMQTLQSLGVPCAMADARHFKPREEAVRSAGLQWSCFAGLSHGEGLDAQGRKLLGLAQSRGGWGCLLSAGLLLSPVPWDTLENLHHGRCDTQSGMHGLASQGIVPAIDAALFEAELLRRLSELRVPLVTAGL